MFLRLRAPNGKGLSFMDYVNVLAALFVAVLAVVTVRLYFAVFPSQRYSPVKMIARVAIFGAMASILYLVPVFNFALPIFPSFLKIHVDEIPAFIAGFAYGPITGIAVVAIKTAAKLILLGSPETMGVGELTDLILSSVYVFIATFAYSKKRNLKGVAIGFGIATAVQIIVAMLLNVYVMIPFYMNVKGYPLDSLLFAMRLANPAISDVGWSYAFLAVLPFNALKDVIVIVLTFLLYRSLHVFLRFEGRKGGKKV